MPSAETFVVDDTHNLIPGRLATFKEWPFTSSSDKCVPRALAEAGFIHRPDVSPDSVQCFVCQKVLGGWEANVRFFSYFTLGRIDIMTKLDY